MNWEPWTGCIYYSEGCKYCYYYGPYAKRYGQDEITKTDKFDWPIRKNKKGEHCIKGDKVLVTCFATDFFHPGADTWRKEAWAMIKERQDIEFLILTKRIDRFMVSLPEDWGEGYDNVNLGCTVETQEIADYRLPLFLSYPIKRRFIACGPMLEKIDLSYYLHGVEHVTVGGETGRDARLCDYDWVLDIRRQCKEAGKTFWFKETGSLFRKNGEIKRINPYKQHAIAKEFGIDIIGDRKLF